MKARKHDLILVEQTHSTFVIGEGHSERTEYTFGIVASTTREGVVKTFRSVGYGDELLSGCAQPLRHGRCYVMPKEQIDVDMVLRAAKAHHWPGHPTQPMPFSTLEEARDIARSARIAA